jgi:hypothetical protein
MNDGTFQCPMKTYQIHWNKDLENKEFRTQPMEGYFPTAQYNTGIYF